MVAVFAMNKAGLEAYQKEIDDVNQASSATCTFSNLPGTAVVAIGEYDVDGTNKEDMRPYHIVSCRVGVRYEADDGREATVGGAVWAGVDVTTTRDTAQWCTSILAAEPWKNLVIQNSWLVHTHGVSDAGYACGIRSLVSLWTQGRTRGSNEVKTGPAFEEKPELYSCPAGKMKHGESTQCTIDQTAHVRLGTKEQQVKQAKQNLADAEGIVQMCLILVIVFSSFVFCSCTLAGYNCCTMLKNRNSEGKVCDTDVVNVSPSEDVAAPVGVAADPA